MNPQELQHKLDTLKGDIQIAQREVDKINHELETMQKTRGDAFKQYDQEIKHKKDQVEEYQREGLRLQKLIALYTTSAESLEGEIKKFKENHANNLKLATDEVQQIHDDAKNHEQAVLNREIQVKGRESAVNTREIQAVKKDEEYVKGMKRNDLIKGELVKKEIEIQTERKNANQAVAKAQVLLDDITRQIREKEKHMQLLDTTLDTKQRRLDGMGKTIEEDRRVVSERERIVAAKEVNLDVKNTEIINAQKKLRDDQQTLRRAYRQTIQRGGSVN